jgi:outer membrane protein insertion porin family
MELEAKWPLYNDNFSRARLRSDIAAIEDYYRGQGFLNVKVVSETERDSSSRRVRIRIGITEGVRTTINAVQIEPSKIPLDTSLYKRLWSRSGRPLINQQIEEDANLLEIRYGELGYLEARADPRILVDSASHTAVVSFEVTEGPRISAGEITINGIKKLNPKVVKREIAFKEGEVLRLSRLRKSERQLYRTNLFSLVSIEPQLGVKDTAAVSGLPDTVYPVKISVRNRRWVRIC